MKIKNGNSNDALQIMKLVDKIYSNSQIYEKITARNLNENNMYDTC